MALILPSVPDMDGRLLNISGDVLLKKVCRATQFSAITLPLLVFMRLLRNIKQSMVVAQTAHLCPQTIHVHCCLQVSDNPSMSTKSPEDPVLPELINACQCSGGSSCVSGGKWRLQALGLVSTTKQAGKVTLLNSKVVCIMDILGADLLSSFQRLITNYNGPKMWVWFPYIKGSCCTELVS